MAANVFWCLPFMQVHHNKAEQYVQSLYDSAYSSTSAIDSKALFC